MPHGAEDIRLDQETLNQAETFFTDHSSDVKFIKDKKNNAGTHSVFKFSDQYRVVVYERLGEGSAGVVKRAAVYKNNEFCCEVALKRIQQRRFDKEGAIEEKNEILKEKELVARVYQHNTEEEYRKEIDQLPLIKRKSTSEKKSPNTTYYYFVLVLFRGRNLINYVIKNDDELYFIMKLIIDMVAKIHALNIAHLDIKPCQFILDVDDKDFKKTQIALSDFGVSVDQPFIPRGGTPEYCSQEIIHGFEYSKTLTVEDGKKADIYALGLTLIRLIRSVPDYNSKTLILTDIEKKMYVQDPKKRADINEVQSVYNDYIPPAPNSNNKITVPAKTQDQEIRPNRVEIMSVLAGVLIGAAIALCISGHIWAGIPAFILAMSLKTSLLTFVTSTIGISTIGGAVGSGALVSGCHVGRYCVFPKPENENKFPDAQSQPKKNFNP